jgi:hypothetical protein
MSRLATRVFRVDCGSVGTPSGELASKVMSWSRNWPTKVIPAWPVGLFLFTC